MASTWYDNGLGYVAAGTLNWASDTIKIMLVTSAYTFDRAAHQYVSDVVGGELSTTNYVRKTLAGKSVVTDTTGHKVDLKADDPVWTALGPATGGPTVTAAVVFKYVSTDANSPILGYLDNSDQTLNGSDITFQLDSQVSNGSVLRISG